MITVCQQPASALFDPGYTFSYVFMYYVSWLGITPEPLSFFIRVSIPLRDSLVVDHVCKGCVITLQGFDTWVDLILLDMLDFDLILGID